jgi:ligand-binding sensor domain-containing protein/signal transduction histidine kinase
MIKQVSFWLLLFLLLTDCKLFAQDIRFKKLPTKSSGSIMGIAQDKRGYIWLTSRDGLMRYDGKQITYFLHDENNKNSIGENWAECIFIDSADIIWLGLFRGGLDRFDPEKKEFTHYRSDPKVTDGLSNDTVSAILEDHEGNLWIGSYGGLELLDRKSNKFTHYSNIPGDSTSLSSNHVRVIYEDHNGELWIGCGSPYYVDDHEDSTSGGLNRLERSTGKFIRYMHDPEDPSSLVNNKISALSEDSRGNFWVGTGLNGLHIMNKTTGKFTHYDYDPSHPENLSGPPTVQFGNFLQTIRFIREDSTGAIWIGAHPNGINRYDPITNKVTHFGNAVNKNNSVIRADTLEGYNDHMPWQFFIARDGTAWVSSLLGHAFMLNPGRTMVPYFPIAEQYANSLYVDSALSAIWIATNKGLVREDQRTHTRKNWKHGPLDPKSLPDDDVSVIRTDANGKFWLGTAKGLVHFDPSSNLFETYRHSNSDKESLGGDVINSLIIDHEGNLWLALSTGLDKYNVSTGKFIHLLWKNPDNRPRYPLYMSLAEDKNGDIWAGSYNGVRRFEGLTQKKYYLLESIIKSIFIDAAGDIWVGSPDGLYRYDKVQDEFLQFRDPYAGQVLASVLDIIEDNKRNLWVQTADNIVKINAARDSVKIFGDNYGVHPNSLLFAHNYKASNGQLFFGDANGYYAFYPEKIKVSSHRPEVFLSGFEISNVEVSPLTKGPLKNSLIRTELINLSHTQNTFSFEFNSLHYSTPGDVKYAFKLENYGNDWNQIGTDHKAYFFNVPPGDYVFRVRAVDADGNFGEKSIQINIAPPWWKTWWAYSLFAVIAGSAIWGLIAYRSRQLKLENKLLEEKVTSRTAELKQSIDNLKKTQSQLVQSEKMASLGQLTAGIAHEIQNPLNFVNNFSDLNAELVTDLQSQLKNGNYDEAFRISSDIRQNEDKINQHGKRAESIVKSMLLHSRTNSGQMDLVDINSLADEYFRIAYHGYRAKDHLFKIYTDTRYDPEIAKMNLNSQEIGRVILNVLNNAFYAVSEKKKSLNGDYEPKVSMQTNKHNGRIDITVMDNGTGIPARFADKIFQPFFTTKPAGQGTGLGLSLSYDIIRAYGGEIKVESTEGEGSKFIISMPA